jgi:hypothetical protein
VTLWGEGGCRYKDEGGSEKVLELNFKIQDANGRAVSVRGTEIGLTLLYEDETEVLLPPNVL